MADRKFASDEEFLSVIAERRSARMDEIDNMHPTVRALVNEYGYHVVDSFLKLGVTRARHIRHLVEVVLDEFSPTRGSNSAQGRRERRNPTTDKGERT